MEGQCSRAVDDLRTFWVARWRWKRALRARSMRLATLTASRCVRARTIRPANAETWWMKRDRGRGRTVEREKGERPRRSQQGDRDAATSVATATPRVTASATAATECHAMLCP